MKRTYGHDFFCFSTHSVGKWCCISSEEFMDVFFFVIFTSLSSIQLDLQCSSWITCIHSCFCLVINLCFRTLFYKPFLHIYFTVDVSTSVLHGSATLSFIIVAILAILCIFISSISEVLFLPSFYCD